MEPPPTTLLLFTGDITDENSQLGLAATVAATAQNMKYTTAMPMTAMGVLWSAFVYAQPTRAADGGVSRTVPIPRPVDVSAGVYTLSRVENDVKAFPPGTYSGQMYLVLSNPKWVPCLDNDIFEKRCRKGPCTAEFGFCDLRRLQPAETDRPGPGASLVSRWVTEFRTVFQC